MPAAATDLFEMVSVSTAEYADVTADGSVPTSWTPIKLIEEGTFNPDFKPGTRTPQYDAATRQVFYVYGAADENKITVTIHKASKQDVATFTGSTVDASGILQKGATTLVNKAFRFTGKTIDGKACTFIAYNADVAVTWSGAIDSAQKAVGLQLSLSLMEDNGTPPHIASFQ